VTDFNQQKSDPRVIVPKPNRMRLLSKQGFGWLDARLHKQGWLAIMTPNEIAAYTFLCLVANPQGISWYRKDRIQAAMCIHEHHLREALQSLYDLDLVAYKPFSRYASDGFHQVLSLPQAGPPNR
jgi:hypothetical protein